MSETVEMRDLSRLSEHLFRVRNDYGGVVLELIPGQKGAYVLLIHLEVPLKGTLRRRTFDLEPGLYAYCGSAMGPGGLKSRVARHRRRDKKVHWHVDQVTTAAPVVAVGISTALSECVLVERLMKEPGCSIPVPGFGSSDCKRCRSHFLKLEDPEAFDALALEPFEA